MERKYESKNGLIAGSGVVGVFQEEAISLQLEDECSELKPIVKALTINKWKFTPLSSLEVSGDIIFILSVIIAHAGIQDGIDQHYSNPCEPSLPFHGMDWKWETNSAYGSESGSEGF